MSHHKIAVIVWAASLALAAVFGTLFAAVEHLSEGLGIYWAISTVTTVGYGDITPHTNAGHWIAAATMLTAIPVWTLSFGLAGSWLVSLHIRKAKDEIKDHVSSQAGKDTG